MKHTPQKTGGFTELILDSISEGVFTTDPALNILSFNRAAEQITGVSREEALGRKCHEVFQANICGEDCPLRSSMRTGEPSPEVEVTIRSRARGPVQVRIRAAVMRDETGALLGAVETFRDVSVLQHLIRRIEGGRTYCDIKGKSPAMKEIFAILPQVAESGSTVLISGESGTGKELVSRALHDLSTRCDGPFVPVNCGSIPDALIESELFGHLKGAFTGAERNRKGRFKAAEGGTLFLDEIGELPGLLQSKLLRALDSGEYTPLGAEMPLKADARIIAATNRDLASEVEAGRFRQDLFYRLNVINLELPPLRRRREDIPLLAEHFLDVLATEKAVIRPELAPDALAMIMEHPWPGNVRELKNALEQAVVLSGGGEILPRHLPAALRIRRTEDPEVAPLNLAGQEEASIRAALNRHQGSRSKAAAELGISTTTLWRKMKKLGLLD